MTQVLKQLPGSLSTDLFSLSHITHNLTSQFPILVLKYLGSDEVEKNHFNLILFNFSPECGLAQLILTLFISLSESTA